VGEAAPGKPQTKLGKATVAAGKGLAGLAAGATGWELGYNMIGPVINEGIDAAISAGAGKDTSLGAYIYDLTHKKAIEAQNPNKPQPPQTLQVTTNLHVDGKLLATVVNDHNARDAKRH